MPVLWLKPSPAQKRQAQLRQYAMGLGLQIKLCDLPQTHRATVRKEIPAKGVVYKLPITSKDGRFLQQNYLLLRTESDFEALGDHSAIQSVLKQHLFQLPDKVSALECNPAGVGAYWREKGAEADIDQIHQVLIDLRKAVLSLGSANKT